MDWAQVLTIIGANFGMFLWLRSEANSDRRDIMQMIGAIQDEIKDFHGRLCVIEENRRK